LDAKDVIICDLTNSHIDEMKKIQNELVNFEGKYVHLDETKNVIISDLKSNYDDVHKKLEKNENEIIELQDFLTKTEMLNNEQMNNFLTIEKNHKLKINEMDDNFEAEIDELRTLLNNKINVLIDQKNIQVLSVEKELKENKEKLNNAEMKINEMHEEIMNDSIPLQEEVRMKYENQIIELEYIINEKNEKNLLYDILVTDYENLKGEKIEFIDVIGKYESDQGLLKASCEEKEKLLQTSSSEIRELHDNVDNQNRIIKDVNDKLNININEIQDRIIENVSLREDIKNVNLQVTAMQF
jgi:chromosome segregation ATPase